MYYRSDICKGIAHAVESGADVISLSVSGTSSVGYEEVIKYAEAAGVIIVASAGNENNSLKRYPAALEYVIAVGATDEMNRRCSFSSYGEWVDIAAPGCNFVSTKSDGDSSYSYGLAGTSFSTPLVAATIGNMIAVNPGLSVEKYKSILFSTATEINDFECGLLNSALAVQKTKMQEFRKSEIRLKRVYALADNRIRVEWDDLDVYGPERIIIYRSTAKNGTYQKIKVITDVDKSSYIDLGLVDGKKYYYKVRAGMKYGSTYRYTPYSNIAFATAKE